MREILLARSQSIRFFKLHRFERVVYKSSSRSLSSKPIAKKIRLGLNRSCVVVIVKHVLPLTILIHWHTRIGIIHFRSLRYVVTSPQVRGKPLIIRRRSDGKIVVSK